MLIGSWWNQKVVYSRYRAIIKNQLKQLASSAKTTGPNFIFAHIICPHDPYLFDAKGNPVIHKGTDEQLVGQVEYISKEIDKVISKIIKDSDKKPVIILQADHGITKDKNVHDLFGILNAYYTDDASLRTKLYEGISPVNNFRLIFDHYFKSNFGLLKDSSFVLSNYYDGQKAKEEMGYVPMGMFDNIDKILRHDNR